VRDWESTTYVSSFKSSDEFGPCLRQEALRRGMAGAGKVVLLIDGAQALEHLGLVHKQPLHFVLRLGSIV
jgi:hypothetical protein